MKNTNNAFALAALATCLLASPMVALADAPREITREELALQSPWCHNTIGQPGYEQMLARYGNGWSHMHHYCLAEIDALRLLQAPMNKPRGYASVGRAIGNLDYVLNNTKPDFAFWKDVMILKIRILDRHSDRRKALRVAQLLLEEKPDLPESYTLLADLLFKSGQRAEAMTLLETGAQKVTDKERFALLRSILPRE